MTLKRIGPGVLAGTHRAGDCVSGKSSDSQNRRRATLRQSNVIRLAVFRDGVFIGNEFCPIGPGLRARIREMAMEGRP
jgi:hypothetical protein